MTLQLTVSEIKTFAACPSEWAYRYYARRAPVTEAIGARERGTITHRAMERAVAEKWSRVEQFHLFMNEAYFDECSFRNQEPREATLESLSVAAERAFRYWRAFGSSMTYLGTEVVLASPSYRGTIDAITTDCEGTWALQYKTVGKAAWIPSLTRLVKRSFHEALYRDLMLANGYDDYRGTRLVAIPLDPLHTRQAGSTCPHCDKKGLAWRSLDLRPIDLSINPRLAARRGLELARVRTAIEMAALACETKGWPECGGPPPVEQRGESTHRCMSPYGNRPLCPFIDMCDEETGADLFDSNTFTSHNPNDRYDDSEVVSQ